MRYNTTFQGEFLLDRPLTTAQKDYLQRFSQTRRMKRDCQCEELRKKANSLRESVGLPLGIEGEYFVGSYTSYGMDEGNNWDSVIDMSKPPRTQPSLWCEWTVSHDGTKIIWSEEDYFYEYIQWLQYLLDNFLKPWGYIVNGQCEWQGQNSEDQGIIYIKDNTLEARRLL